MFQEPLGGFTENYSSEKFCSHEYGISPADNKKCMFPQSLVNITLTSKYVLLHNTLKGQAVTESRSTKCKFGN